MLIKKIPSSYTAIGSCSDTTNNLNEFELMFNYLA
jgi:hypothetical protein